MATGSITDNSTPVTLTSVGGSRVLIQLTGTYSGISVVFEVSADGTTWKTLLVHTSDATWSGSSLQLTDNASYIFLADVPSASQIRVRPTSYTSGPANLILLPGSQSTGGFTTVASTTFTRPADTTAYAVGDLVANSTTAGSVNPMQFSVARLGGGSGMIRRARLQKSGTSVTNAQFRLHLYKSIPTPANGDNGAWSTDQSANYLGSMDVTLSKAFTDGAADNGVPNTGSEINFALTSGQVIYGLTEARAAYTPGNAEIFQWTLEVLQN